MTFECPVYELAESIKNLSRATRGVPKVWIEGQMRENLDILYEIWPTAKYGTPAMPECATCGFHGADVFIALCEFWTDCLKLHMRASQMPSSAKPEFTSEMAIHYADLTRELVKSHLRSHEPQSE